ncbi:hypothetical protein BDM02DRAFT_875687 [Thelephora ganbajun]|uniref:Uncharacterized protein n=1 Tax=Thelephora ganbajun TaxID=370292 RepID=A0ACB6Z576_THEGA|nr:hypothetical protein BDM02DRAFT_875687 [Thelephora ganbajun]
MPTGALLLHQTTNLHLGRSSRVSSTGLKCLIPTLTDTRLPPDTPPTFAAQCSFLTSPRTLSILSLDTESGILVAKVFVFSSFGMAFCGAYIERISQRSTLWRTLQKVKFLDFKPWTRQNLSVPSIRQTRTSPSPTTASNSPPTCGSVEHGHQRMN